MDKDHKIAARLFRDHCVCSEGIFVKDLGLLGRDLNSVVMIDNSATSYKFQPKNGIECVPFIDNKDDRELIESCCDDIVEIAAYPNSVSHGYFPSSSA